MKCDRGSCSILFWHLAQWQCTSNPEMNFSANPDYYTTHPPQRHPIQLGSEIWLPTSRHAMSKLEWINRINLKYCTQRARNTVMHLDYYFQLSQKNLQLSLSPAWSPFLRTLKSQNHFPFSSHSDVPQKSPWFILALISYSEGKTKEFSETLTLLSWRGNWAYTATVVW